MRIVLGRLLAAAALCASSSAWSATEVYIDSPDGDWVGGGQQYTFNDATSYFQLTHERDDIVSVYWDDWRAQFVARSGEAIVPGNYEGATRYPFNTRVNHGLDVAAMGHGCNTLKGWFEVHEATFAGNVVVSLAVDFMQSCDGMPWLFGAIRHNSSVPLHRTVPYARVPREIVAEEEEPVLLDGVPSFDRQSSIVFSWTQDAGVPVALAEADRARAHFFAPAVNPGGEQLQFSLTATDGDGNSDVESVQVHVYDSTDLRTRAFLDSESGDFIGQGLTYWYDEATALLSGSAYGSQIDITLEGDEKWRARLILPEGMTTWQPGLYVDANNAFAAIRDPVYPGVGFDGEGRGCNYAYGAFRIYDVEIVGTSVLRLAADFVQHCEYSYSVLFGAIRINSSEPLHHTLPFAIAAPAIQAGVGEQVTLDGSASSRGSGGLTYQWTQTGGTAVTLNGAGTAVATFTAPAAPAGGETLTFELRVTDAEGHVDTTVVTVHVAGPGDPRTVVYLESAPDDWIGQGQTITFDAATIRATRWGGDRGVRITFDDSAEDAAGWDAVFNVPAARGIPGDYYSEPVSRTVDPGNYDEATRYPFNSPLSPGIAVSAPHRGCGEIDGWFEVHEAEYLDGQIVRFAADLLQSCEGATPTFGAVRINSGVPLHRAQPYARATGPRVATEGDAIVLDGAKSFDRAGPIASYAWSQVAGRAVALGATNTATLAFTAPEVPPGGEYVQFRLSVTDGDGNADSETVAFYVYDRDDYRKRVLIRSQEGDWVGQGATWYYDEGNAYVVGSAGGSLAIHVEGETWWDGSFSAPPGEMFELQMYGGAWSPWDSVPLRPGLEFSGDGRTCGRLDGWFETHELGLFAYTVLWAAVDFYQVCDGATAGSWGAMRVNSAVPLERNVVYAVAGKDHGARRGETVTLDGALSFSPAGNPLNFSWQQVSGPAVTLSDVAGATPSFAATEAGEYVFALTVSDAPGRVDTDEVRVVVHADSEPQTWVVIESDPDHYVTQGERLAYSLDNARITVQRNYDQGIAVYIDGGEAWWDLHFAGPNDAPLQAGMYENAQAWPWQSGQPGISFTGSGRACGGEGGSFRVYQVEYAPDGSVQTAAIDFEHGCIGAAHGQIRINFRPDSVPTADAGADQTVEQQTPVTLDGFGSTDLQGPLAAYAWRQVAGRAVTLSGAETARPGFAAPALLDAAVPETFVFEVTVTDSDGFTASDTTTVTVVEFADRDGDGVRDSLDAFPSDPAETTDSDGDGVGDNGDAFPGNPAESADNDGDGVGNNADAFDDDPNETTDGDGDGVGDNGDAFPANPAESADSDGDGTGNNADAFDDNPNETTDSDGDGVGDNGDAFPNNPAETVDSDGDGTGNNADAFDNDPAESVDSDGDGVGNNADAFDSDPNETTDSDNDGVGDNGDAFPGNPAESADSDGDGVGNNTDELPDDPAETTDHDDDGIGDIGDSDDDNDGKSDSTEALAPNGDGNEDGIADSRQAGVATFTDASGGIATIAVGPAATLNSAGGVANPSPSTTPARAAIVRGFFGVQIGVAPGGAATVTLYLHDGGRPTGYLKHGPLPGGGSGFYEFLYDGTTGAEFPDGPVVVLHFVDGARGDADGAANGVITDPGAPTWPAAIVDPPPGGGGGGGGGGSPSGGLLMLFAALAALRRCGRGRDSR